MWCVNAKVRGHEDAYQMNALFGANIPKRGINSHWFTKALSCNWPNSPKSNF